MADMDQPVPFVASLRPTHAPHPNLITYGRETLAKFIVFNTKFIIDNTESMVFNAKSIISHPLWIYFRGDLSLYTAALGKQCIRSNETCV